MHGGTAAAPPQMAIANGEGGTAWSPPPRITAINHADPRSTLLHLVQRQIQLQHVHARFTKHAELAASRITIDQRLHVVGGELTRFGDAFDLVRGGGRADLRIETAARG